MARWTCMGHKEQDRIEELYSRVVAVHFYYTEPLRHACRGLVRGLVVYKNAGPCTCYRCGMAKKKLAECILFTLWKLKVWNLENIGE